jgi:hypothetical protein
MLYMHRIIAGAPKGKIVDHINGDTLFNVCWNLRVGTQRENLGNMRLNRRSTSGYKGVSYMKQHKTYRAYIRIDDKQRHIGCYKTADEAATAYNEKALEVFGKYARLNIVAKPPIQQ